MALASSLPFFFFSFLSFLLWFLPRDVTGNEIGLSPKELTLRGVFEDGSYEKVVALIR